MQKGDQDTDGLLCREKQKPTLTAYYLLVLDRESTALGDPTPHPITSDDSPLDHTDWLL